MRGLILCPGPSLTRSLEVAGEDVDAAHRIIVVNRARDFTPWHDWWVAGDIHSNPKNLGGPVDQRTRLGLCSIGAAARPAGVEWRAWSELPFSVTPTSYSSIAALALAWSLGCTEIAVLGADMDGTTYAGNRPMPADADPGRWEHERILWEGMAATIRSHGVRVHRLAQPLGGGPLALAT